MGSVGPRLLAVLALLWISCGEEVSPDPGDDPSSTDASRTASITDSAEAPLSPSGRALRSYPLRLVNGGERDAVVHGRAGAREVVLDTLAAGDSVLLRVRLRTDSLVIRMDDMRGGTVVSGVVRFPADVAVDSVTRWKAP